MPREPASAWLLNAAIALVLMAAPAGASAADLQNGEEINEVCAGCHGDLGQGGKEGEYPRLAGQPAAFFLLSSALPLRFPSIRRPDSWRA